MNKLLLTAAAAALALAAPAMAQDSTGTQVAASSAMVCGPSTASTATTTDTAASTTTGTSSTTGTTGTSTDTAASSSGTSTETTGSTTAAPATGSRTMGLSADNQVISENARTALGDVKIGLDKLTSLTPTVVCLVDLDAVQTAQNDQMLKDDITKFRSNNAQIKSALEGNTALMEKIKAQHPSFDVNQVIATDVGPSGELFLYITRS